MTNELPIEFRDAACSGDVRLNDPHRLFFQQFAEAMPAEDAFTRRQRHIHRTLDFDHRRDVFGRNRFFIKEQPVWFQGADNLNRRLGVPSGMHVNGECRNPARPLRVWL